MASSPSLRRRTRGTAEIETLLVIPILLFILFLAGGLAVLGRARLANVSGAESNAYAQNVIGLNLTSAVDPVPVDGPASVRPGLPSRFAESKLNSTVSIPFGNSSMTKVLADKALFLDPAWQYASFANRDQGQIEAWFEDYVAEDHPGDVNAALGLQPSWPP